MPTFFFPNDVMVAASIVAAASLGVLIYLLWRARAESMHRRLAGLSGGDVAPPFLGAGSRGSGATSGDVAKSRMDQWVSRRLREQEKKDKLQERMIHAGFYGTSVTGLFFLIRLGLVVGATAIGFLASHWAQVPPIQGLLFGLIAGLAGTLAPGMWLDFIKRKRQIKIRRALPDALDIIVVCLQGGLSLGSALSHVSRELAMAHPALAVELRIIERQVQMGRSIGDAIREMANRFDLEELRGMASVITQVERIGASLAKALEIFAEGMRLKRYQRAEEMAHKASVKMLFPTVFLIFPALFVVLLGPAAIQVYRHLILGLAGAH